MNDIASPPHPAAPSRAHQGIAWPRHRCVVLLASLVLLLVVYPYALTDSRDETALLDAAVCLVMLSGVYAVSRRRWELVAAVALFAPAAFGPWIDRRPDLSVLGLILNVGVALFCGFVSVMVLRYMFDGTRHALDQIFGSLGVYLFMAVGFASAYETLHLIEPQSFAIADHLLHSGDAGWTVFLYFSFVTQTTLGYGDMSPATPAAQSLVMIQATTGVLYTAVLVAWLVGSLKPPTLTDALRSTPLTDPARLDSGHQ